MNNTYELKSVNRFPFVVTTLDLTAAGQSRERYIIEYTYTLAEAEDRVAKILANPNLALSEPTAEPNPNYAPLSNA